MKNGAVRVLAPYFTSKREILDFVEKHRGWIEKQLKASAEAQNVPALTESEMRLLKEQAKAVLPAKAAAYAKQLQVAYGKITVRFQKTRWGSCSSKGNLSFNALLMRAPEEVQDAIVVHELCHLKEMNHSKAFYDLVRSVYPQYDECMKWLKKNGRSLMAALR